MRTFPVLAAAIVMWTHAVAAQIPPEKKPVPKDSVRVSIAGCAKGYVFTAGRNMPDVVAGLDIPAGMHLRLNGPKKAIQAIDAYKGSMIEITGLMKKGQLQPDGVHIGGAVRLMPASPPASGGIASAPMASPIEIDVEGWNPSTGTCAAS